MSRFVTVNRDTAYLLPPSVDEWLPKEHVARYVAEVVEALDLSAMTRCYAGRGSDAHHPTVLVALLIYGYATGTYSSRKIEAATYDSLAFRYIAGNTHPDHDTLATFRKRSIGELKQLFVQLLLIARENRHYARRQLIWFRKEPNLVWLRTSGEDPDTLTAVEALLP